MGFKQLATDMCEAGNFLDVVDMLQVFKTDITVGVKPAAVVFEMFFGPSAFAIRRIVVGGGRTRVTSPVPFIAKVDPQSSGLGSAGAGARTLTGVSSARMAAPGMT